MLTVLTGAKMGQLLDNIEFSGYAGLHRKGGKTNIQKPFGD